MVWPIMECGSGYGRAWMGLSQSTGACGLVLKCGSLSRTTLNKLVSTPIHRDETPLSSLEGIEAARLTAYPLGRKMENVVPRCWPVTCRRTRMDPPCFSMIPHDTHKPSPVPASFLVE